MDIYELQNEGNLFWSIVSSSFGEEPNTFIKRETKKVLKNGGALVYIYSNNFNKFSKENFMNQWDIDFQLINGQVKFVCLEEEIMKNNKIDREKILKIYDNKIEELKDNGFEDIIIYTTRYNFYKEIFGFDGLINLHKEIKKVAYENNIIIAIRYIINDFYEKDFLKLISLHDTFILEGSEKIEVYTYIELFKTGFVNLSRKGIIEEEHEKELRKIEKLKTIGEFAEGLAHDFNNLLTTIVGYSQIALLKDIEDEIKNYFNVIYRTALDGKAIMNRIQDFAKGTDKINRDFHYLNDLVLGSLDMARHRIKVKSKTNGEIKIIEKLDSESRIYCNEYEIRQVMLNIILNALDSMVGSGTLILSTYDLDEKAVIEVEDTGIGMEDRVKEKLFEPYFTTKGSKGTGLGLNIAKKILEDHFAEIKVESESGKGSKFIISFPILEEDLDEIPMIEGKKYNALIIENEYIKAYKLIELFSLLNIGTEVEFLKDEVLEKLSHEKYDLIISCYDPVDIEGIMFFKKIKKKFPNIPFILAVDNIYILETDLYNIADGVVEKGCTVDELSYVVKKLLNSVDNEDDKSYNIN
ncbi:MAG TPA: HAMP domain-containing sensor histidine kinase [Tissierellales bacterium]|nr:HAMP domain-containing sensor histidine kinase [Tissierellales bacterium]